MRMGTGRDDRQKLPERPDLHRVLTEDQVPLEQRYLVVEGAVSSTSLDKVRGGLPPTWPQTTRCLFALYAYADLPIGKRFDFAFCEHAPAAGELTSATIDAVTQQWAKPFDGVPHGHKTICLIDFPQGVPPLIAGLRTIDSWASSDQRVCLCTRATLTALLEEAQGSRK